MTDPTAAVPPPVDNASAAEDFIDIFTSPSKVFARRAKASPMVPFLTVCIVMAVLFFASKNVLAPIFDAQIQKQMELQMKTNPQLTQDVIDKSKPMMNVIISITGVIGIPIIMLVMGLVLWVVGRFFMGGMLTYGTALMITAFSWFPNIISGVIGMVEGLTMDVSRLTSPLQLSVSVARFLDPDKVSNGLYQLLGRIDVFSIWGTILTIIGLIYAGKLDKSKAVTGGVIVFVVGCIPALFAVLTGK